MDDCVIYLHETLTSSDHGLLFALYRPLMGMAPCLLYEVMVSLAKGENEIPLRDVLGIAGLSEGQFSESRKKLEQFRLLKTYRNETGQYAFVLFPPLNVKKFMESPVFSRLLFNRLSNEGIERIQAYYSPHENLEGYADISAHLSSEQVEENWTSQKEKLYLQHLPQPSDLEKYDFNFVRFYQGQDNVFPERLRTPENEVRIAQLANTYGVDEITMRHYCSRGRRDEKTRFDFDFITELLANTTKVTKSDPKDYSASPSSFLKSRQPKNAEILPRERQLISDLSETMQLPNEVVNTLLEYSMQRNHGAIFPKYVKTTANNWIRAGVDSREKALKLIEDQEKEIKYGRQSPKQEKGQLPDWYNEIPTEKVSEQEAREFQEWLEKELAKT